MYNSVYDLKAFYNSKQGRVVRRVMQQRIRGFWPNVRGLNVLGCGYAVPYLRVLMEEAERVVAMMPAGQGALSWPHDGDNLVFLSGPGELPIESNSVDRVLMIHDLEFSKNLQLNLQEIWRALKSNGRLLVIVPNRAGVWARADGSPFGHGTPYSLSQLRYYLRESSFVYERSEEALFMPPLQSSFILKSAGVWENLGVKIFPMVAGVHMVEVSKQLYARADPGAGVRSRVRGRGSFVPKPAVRAGLFSKLGRKTLRVL